MWQSHQVNEAAEPVPPAELLRVPVLAVLRVGWGLKGMSSAGWHRLEHVSAILQLTAHSERENASVVSAPDCIWNSLQIVHCMRPGTVGRSTD
ncbi:hypothetical protein GJAV_G00169090 [Gymnothorax javanicus]|nr:hypothetical protein GJAV_G00169090 [Gymnothorax javanicus]